MSKETDFSKPVRMAAGSAAIYHSFRVIGVMDGGEAYAVAYIARDGTHELLARTRRFSYWTGIENVPEPLPTPGELLKDSKFWLCYIDGNRGGAKVAHKTEAIAMQEAKRISQLADTLGKTVYVCEAKHAVVTTQTSTTTVKSV